MSTASMLGGVVCPGPWDLWTPGPRRITRDCMLSRLLSYPPSPYLLLRSADL